MIVERGLSAADRPRIEALLASFGFLTSEERAVALELVDHRLEHPASDDYRFILSAFTPDEGGTEKLAGYLCYGRTPMTRSTYDLYWLGTSPEYARSGIARGLVSRMEAEIAGEGGGLIRVETGSRDGHGDAIHLYDALGFTRAATIADFYAPHDDLVIFTRRVPGHARDPIGEPAARLVDEAALYDAAFGYRDHVAERDFLLACARRYGDRDVRRALAWSSGTGRLLKSFLDAGIAGAGVEASEPLIAFAERVARARAAGPSIGFVRAALDEPVHDRIEPVDLSFVLLSAIHLLATPDAIARHLRSAASVLAPGGVHVIEATHPADLLPSGVNRTEWTEARGDTMVEARFRMHVDRATPDRVVPVTLEVTCTTGKKGAAPAPRLKHEDRWFIPDLDGWRAIIALVPELSLVAALGDFNVAVPFEHQAAWRLILVLKRASSA